MLTFRSGRLAAGILYSVNRKFNERVAGREAEINTQLLTAGLRYRV
jgi:hypothetical protein